MRWPPKKQTNKLKLSSMYPLLSWLVLDVFTWSCFQEDSGLNSTQIFRYISVSFPPAFNLLPFGFWCRLHPTSADEQQWFFITSSCPPDSHLREGSKELCCLDSPFGKKTRIYKLLVNRTRVYIEKCQLEKQLKCQ